jgi:hypothetical protein
MRPFFAASDYNVVSISVEAAEKLLTFAPTGLMLKQFREHFLRGANALLWRIRLGDRCLRYFGRCCSKINNLVLASPDLLSGTVVLAGQNC